MTENEKNWYIFANEPEMQKTVRESRQKLSQINRLSEVDETKAVKLLQEFLSNLTGNSRIMFPITNIEYPEQFHLGEHSFINANLQIISNGKVTIGQHTFIGPNCQIYTVNHSSDLTKRRTGWQYDLPVTIGDDCWLGASVILLPGVTIGNDVIVGAGSVVTKNFPDHCMIAGNPAKIIKNL